MLCTVKRDKKRRNLAKKEEIKRIHAKTILQDLQLKKPHIEEVANNIKQISCSSISKAELFSKDGQNRTDNKSNIFTIATSKKQKQDSIFKTNRDSVEIQDKDRAQGEKLEDFLRSEIFKKQKTSLASFLYEKASKGITRNGSKSRIKNRCIETGRAKSILRDCRLSRIKFREHAAKGFIPGICKTSW